MKPDISELRSYFLNSHDAKGLVFANDSGRGGRYKAGTKAGSTQDSGHRVVCFKGSYYPESHIVWALAHDEWPYGHLSNINGDLQDNRPENLYLSGHRHKHRRPDRNPSIERLRFLFSYDADTGELVRKVAKPPHNAAGEIVGVLNDSGYLTVALDGYHHRVHRIIWAIAHGYWPAKSLDHINGNRSDNCLSNLREATVSQNSQNSKIRSTNQTGVKGVRLRADTGKYHAFINIDKKGISLGCFDGLQDAAEARRKAEMKYHPFRKESS